MNSISVALAEGVKGPSFGPGTSGSVSADRGGERRGKVLDPLGMARVEEGKGRE